MKKRAIKSGKTQKTVISVMATLVITLSIYFFLPVHISAFKTRREGQLFPFGPISRNHQLEFCLDGHFTDFGVLKLFTATYARPNTSHYYYSIYSNQQGKAVEYYQSNFQARHVPDNDFLTLSFPVVKNLDNFCTHIWSDDAAPDNAITVWLNRDGDPVIKLEKKSNGAPLYQAIMVLISQNPTPLPVVFVEALLLACLGGMVYIVQALTIKLYEAFKKL